MKPNVFICMILMGCLGSTHALADAPAAPPATLTLQDLVNRPDRWPATITIQGDLKLRNGAVVHQGDKVHVELFDGTRVGLVAPGNIRFAMAPADCGLLDAANQAWSALTPAQRAIDRDSLVADPSVWPVKVNLTGGLKCSFGTLPPGTEVALLTVTSRGVDIAWPNSANRVTIDLGSSDVLDRARQLALLDPDKRDSRIAAALNGIMVDADGKPYHDDHLADKKFFALYFGAGWCPPCRTFSPDLVKFMTDALPAHPELAAVLLSNDKQLNDMLGYMKDEKMPFPAVAPDELDRSPLLNSYAAQLIPTVVIVDRFGKVLATSDDNKGNRIDPKDTLDALNKMLTAPTTQP